MSPTRDDPSLDELRQGDLAAVVRAQRIAQGLPAELTDEQMDFIGAVVFSALREQRRRHREGDRP